MVNSGNQLVSASHGFSRLHQDIYAYIYIYVYVYIYTYIHYVLQYIHVITCIYLTIYLHIVLFVRVSYILPLKTWTLSSMTVVICSSCIREHRPLGKRTTMSAQRKPLTLSIAALPVSPDVPGQFSKSNHSEASPL